MQNQTSPKTAGQNAPQQAGSFDFSRRRQRERDLEPVECLFLALTHIEELVQLRDGEDLVDIRPDAAQSQLPFGCLHLLVHSDQFPQCGAREILHVREIEDDLLATVFFDQPKKLVSDDLDVSFVENLLVDKLRDCGVANFLDVQSTVIVCHFSIPVLREFPRILLKPRPGKANRGRYDRLARSTQIRLRTDSRENTLFRMAPQYRDSPKVQAYPSSVTIMESAANAVKHISQMVSEFSRVESDWPVVPCAVVGRSQSRLAPSWAPTAGWSGWAFLWTHGPLGTAAKREIRA